MLVMQIINQLCRVNVYIYVIMGDVTPSDMEKICPKFIEFIELNDCDTFFDTPVSVSIPFSSP